MLPAIRSEPAVGIVGESSSVMRIKQLLPKLGRSDCNVLITGETGTGKEMIAAAVHEFSGRPGCFVAVNCAAMPDTLLEAELFGYEKGAFTGAVKRADGHLHAAHRGTLFLDEIGDMSTVAQAKVLRALETRCVQRVGSRETMPVDVRFVAATNQNLDRMVSQGSFRADLYFRVNVAQIDLPPLRERAEDIPCLVAHFLSQFGADGVTLSDDVSAFFSTYSWPGNIRELRNVIQSTLVYLDSPLIRLRDLPRRFVMAATGEKAAPDAERDKLLEVLEQTEWNKSRAAEMLHWSRMTLYRKMTKYQIQDKTAFVK